MSLERDAVRRTGDGALAADLAEVLDADVDGLVRHQRQVGHDRVGHVDRARRILADDEPIAAQLADAGGEPAACGFATPRSAV